MQLKNVHHVSLNVTNVEECRKFYVDVLGLEVRERPDLGFPGLWLKVGGQEIHLLELDSGSPLKEQHFAFEVDDIDSTIEQLRAAGVTCSDAQEIPNVCKQAFFHDPSANLLEINQPL